MATFQTGDIFLTDSSKSYARVVKFLMQAPTLWHWLWRKLRGTQQEVRFYHAGMILDESHIIEQQKVVEIDNIDTILDDPHIVFRNTNLVASEIAKLKLLAEHDLGKGYDVALIFGKTLTWLTGVKPFARLLGLVTPNQEICVTRVASWYDKAIGEKFGQISPELVTTDIIDDYCSSHATWIVVSHKENV